MELQSVPTPGIWNRYRDNLPRHLIGISRDLQSRVTRSLAEKHGHHALRLSFAPFLSLIWDRGRTIGEIAGELCVSKQACSQLATMIERAGYLERASNPRDRRSKVVRLTRAGNELVDQGASLILECEFEYAGLVSSGPYRRFTEALLDLYRGLGLPAQAKPPASQRQAQSAGLLPPIVERVQRSLMEGTIARGHAGLKMSHGQVLTLIGPEGGRVHEIARIQRVSRQAISAISRDLEQLGYLLRSADPFDRRGVVLTLSARGEALIADSVDAMDELEHAYRDLIGADQLEHLERVAYDLYHALHLENEIFEPTHSTPSGHHIDEEAFSSPGRRNIEQLAGRLREKLDRAEAAQLVKLLEIRTKTARGLQYDL